jgi:hypothetical protein
MPHTALIINPWATDFKLYDEWMHPLGLYFLISLLRRNGWKVFFINCLARGAHGRPKRYSTAEFPYQLLTRPTLYRDIPRAYKQYGISAEEFADRVRAAGSFDLVCIGSAMTYWIDGLTATLSAINSLLPKTPVIVGGLAAMLMPELLRRRFPASTIFSGSLLGDPSVLRTTHPLLADLTVDGWQPSLIDAYECFEEAFHGPLLTSLGCPMRCTYCASSRLQPRFKWRDQALVIDEAAFLARRFGVRDFSVFDDALLYESEDHLIALLNIWKQRLPDTRLHSPNGLHLRWLTAKTARAMVDAGFTSFRFGYESGQPIHRQDTSAKIGPEELREKVGLLTSIGVPAGRIGIYVMAGFIDQLPAMVLEEMAFVASSGVKPKPVFLSPVPGTNLYEHYRKSYPRLDDDPLFHNDTFFTSQLPGWSWEAVDGIMRQAKAYGS